MVELDTPLPYPVYAKRSIVGGLEFYSDDVGGGQFVVDLTTVDVALLKWIVENHREVEKIVPE